MPREWNVNVCQLRHFWLMKITRFDHDFYSPFLTYFITPEMNFVSHSGLLLGTVPLSGFTRRMLLQVLLEDEKVTVALRASPEFYCRLNISSMAGNGSSGTGEKGFGCQVHHPRFGAGRGSCSVTVNINSPCSEVLTRFGGECMACGALRPWFLRWP